MDVSMSIKNLIIEFLNVLWNEQQLDAIDNFIDQAAHIESPLGKAVGCQGKYDIMTEWFNGFSGMSYQPIEIYLEKNIQIFHGLGLLE